MDYVDTAAAARFCVAARKSPCLCAECRPAAVFALPKSGGRFFYRLFAAKKVG